MQPSLLLLSLLCVSFLFALTFIARNLSPPPPPPASTLSLSLSPLPCQLASQPRAAALSPRVNSEVSEPGTLGMEKERERENRALRKCQKCWRVAAAAAASGLQRSRHVRGFPMIAMIIFFPEQMYTV